jgi:hypothetical protein
MILHFQERGTGKQLNYEFVDIDGPGGNNPIIDPIVLNAQTVYDLSIEVLDESKFQPVNITEEILEEGTVHRFYFEPSSTLPLTIANLSSDSTGMPLGLEAVWTTGAASKGTIMLTLRHYENGGKETSDPVNSTKSNTDAAVEFKVEIN